MRHKEIITLFGQGIFYQREARCESRLSHSYINRQNGAKMIQKKGKKGHFLSVFRHYLTTPERSFL
jgi:hypothetical protein